MQNTPSPSDAVLRSFLDEGLPPTEMASIEQAMRNDPSLLQRLLRLRGEQDAGIHSIGSIWRRHQLSCPDRNELRQYLLGVLDQETEQYIRFHVNRIGCRFCSANLLDLERRRDEASGETQQRRQRYLQTSAGYLKR